MRDVLNMIGRYDPFVRSCLARADVILASDEATKREVPSALRHKAFISTDIYAPELAARAEPGEQTRTGQRILFAGRLECWKGPHLAIGAIAKLTQKFPGVTLTIVGAGPDEAFLRERVTARGLDAVVTFAGLVPHDRMHGQFASHDLFLFPSLHETGGMVIGEALVAGTPVVCLNLGGPPNVVDETCGAVVDALNTDQDAVEQHLATAVAALIEDPDALAEKRRGALTKAEAITYPARVRHIAQNYYKAATA
ncbi:MAG: glycosyltransferase [Pseudomonadota bacterium]